MITEIYKRETKVHAKELQKKKKKKKKNGKEGGACTPRQQ